MYVTLEPCFHSSQNGSCSDQILRSGIKEVYVSCIVALTVVDITAGVPTLPARFTWDFQELQTDSWTEQADDDSVWSTQADSSDTWTEATEPTDIWTDVTDPTDTWSEAA